jgi:hypothetical protein
MPAYSAHIDRLPSINVWFSGAALAVVVAVCPFAHTEAMAAAAVDDEAREIDFP